MRREGRFATSGETTLRKVGEKRNTTEWVRKERWRKKRERLTRRGVSGTEFQKTSGEGKENVRTGKKGNRTSQKKNPAKGRGGETFKRRKKKKG